MNAGMMVSLADTLFSLADSLFLVFILKRFPCRFASPQTDNAISGLLTNLIVQAIKFGIASLPWSVTVRLFWQAPRFVKQVVYDPL